MAHSFFHPSHAASQAFRQRFFRAWCGLAPMPTAAAAVIVVALSALPLQTRAQIVAVGKGSYTTVLPAGCKTPADSTGLPIDPQLTPDFSQPAASNEWWSSFLYKRVPLEHHNSGKSYPHPLSVRGAPTGLEIGYTTKPDTGMDWEWLWAGGTYEYAHAPDMVVGIDGLNIYYTKTAGYSDWAVTADWTDGTKNLRATIAHGNPYVFFRLKGGNAKIAFTSAQTVWSGDGAVMGVTIAGHDYGIFAPTGSVWTASGASMTSSLNGKDYLSVALLPDGLATDAARKQVLALFQAHAYAFLIKTKASWSYDENTATVTSTLTSTTQAMEGTETQTLQALYRHQWLATTSPLTAYTYSSPRGAMKLLTGNTFVTLMPFTGILPVFPDKGYDKNTLKQYLAAEAGYAITDGDTYGTGKSLGRVAMLAELADQLGDVASRTAFINKLKDRLQGWFTAQPGKTRQIFYYDQKWNTLFGYPASFHSDDEINDHHFHAGYFLMAAAEIAKYDADWASPQNWGGMVDVLLRDVANWDDADARFPHLRNFDPYAGHSWAHGSEYYGRGNNQESSSESMNFHTALFLWGTYTKNKTLRDLAIYMYTNEANAVQQYWLDADKAVFPSFYPNPCIGQLMSNGGTYHTFFGDDANYIHLINFLPLTTGSVYLSRHPANIKANIDWMYNHPYRFQGKTGEWDDVAWGTLAFADPAAALARFGNFASYGAFDGESKAHIYQLVMNLSALGDPNPDVRADVPTFCAFDKGTVRTYAAYNPDDAQRTIKFTDGGSLTLAPHTSGTGTGIVVALAAEASGPRVKRGRVALGYEGLRVRVGTAKAFTLTSPSGRTLWSTKDGRLPTHESIGDGLILIHY